MGIGDRNRVLGATLVAAALMSGCGDDLLGHPGSDRPDPARQHLRPQAQQLIDEQLAGLPQPIIDLAAWPHPQLSAQLPALWSDAAIADAVAGSAPHSLLRNQLGVGVPVRSFVRFARDDWPDRVDWHQAEADNPGHDATWLDTSDGNHNWQDQLNAMPADQTVVLLHCGAGQVDRLRACLRALRDRDNTLLALGGLTSRDAIPDALMLLMQQTSLHARYRWSSAWPRPAVNWLIWLRPLAKHGFIAEADIAPLREIYADNPLLFDLVLWRSIRLPDTDIGLPAEAFSGLPMQDSADPS